MPELSALIYCPIKSCRGFEVDASNVERMGMENDRRMMVVTPDGEYLTQRDYPKPALVTPSISGDELTLPAKRGQARAWHEHGNSVYKVG